MIPERRAFGGWSMGRIIRVGLIAIGVSILGLMVVYVAVRLRGITALQVEYASLHAEHRALQEQHFALIKDLEYRQDETEKVLYGDVWAKLKEKQKVQAPSRIELWQETVTKDLRERMTRLERRMMQIEELLR